MATVRQIAVYKKKGAGAPAGKFYAAAPMDEHLVYAAELSEGEGAPRRVFGKTLAVLAKNIALNMEAGDEFRLGKRDTNGSDTFAVEDSEVKALEHAITHHRERNNGRK